MIFFGRNSSTISKGQIRNVICLHCENNVTMNYNVIGKYAHLYWIPLFPMGKVNIVECNNCKATFDLKNLNENINRSFKNELGRNPAKTPLTHFSALGIIGLIILGVFYSNRKTDDQTLEFAKNPKVGDIYYFETPELKDHYSTFKITKITKDSLFVLENKMEIASKTDMDDILVDNNYTIPNAYRLAELREASKNLKVFFKITRK